MKFLFKTRFTVFDLICWCVFAALINYASPWWLLAIVPVAAVAAIVTVSAAADNFNCIVVPLTPSDN